MAQDASALVRFYAGEGPDPQGRALKQIWSWDDVRLEDVHDYIQWLFPLPEPSQYSDGAPLLTAADIEAFQARPELRENLRHSLRRMLAFYGFALEAGPKVVHASDFAFQAVNWLKPFDHNFLRVTRILRSLYLLGLGDEARAFLATLEELYNTTSGGAIGERTIAFWRDAVPHEHH